jgi:hypothetical protein
MSRIANLLCVLCIALVLAVIGFAQVLSDPERFDAAHIPIFDSRVFRVSDAAQDRALQILAAKDFCPASPENLKELFGARVFDTKEMLAAQVGAATKYATKRDEESKIAFFGEHRVWMAAHAKAHREFAAYTEKLPWDLRPYLVRGQAYFEGTGGFSVVLSGKLLEVHHSCLGRSAPEKKAVAILVFLERDIEAVKVSASITE